MFRQQAKNATSYSLTNFRFNQREPMIAAYKGWGGGGGGGGGPLIFAPAVLNRGDMVEH